MSLQDKVMDAMKAAMKAKDTLTLESLRAIKSAILLAKTETRAGEELTAEQENKLLQKLVKQRKDSAAIYKEQGRPDLAEPELAQAAIIEVFLPAQATDEEIRNIVLQVIKDTDAQGMKDMGKVIGLAQKQLAGKADGKVIAEAVKAALGN